MEIPQWSYRQKIQVKSKEYREKKKAAQSSEGRRSCEIPLTKGYFAIVDSEDFHYLNQWKWHYNDGYAERKENGKHIRMHRIIKNAPESLLVDHINGNKLDNRKSNLRLATRSENAMNMRKHKGSSVYKGVTKRKYGWRVQIWKDNKKAFDASAPTELMGALIYDLNAPLLFGKFARLNFPNALKATDAPPAQLELA